MPPGALLLALGAAVLHAGWNLLLAREEDTGAATSVALLTLLVVMTPVAALTWHVEGAAVPYVAGSGLLELAYVALLAAAYSRYELSVVYPLARGLAPVAALAIAAAFALATPSATGIAGVLVVAAGILLVRGARGGSGAVLGLTIGLVIGGYTVIDRYGIQHASAAPYLLLVLGLPAVAYPLALRDPARIRLALRPVPFLIGLGTAGAYLLVLLALRRAPAASVAAVRESSVVIATALAALVLREQVGRRRLLGSAVVVAGVALLAVS
jgi:drug/metabolite transporter (DMT)-like permease